MTPAREIWPDGPRSAIAGCSKPGCVRTGAAILGYDYEARRAVLSDPTPGEISPHLYILCLRCAERLRPPRGWELVDERTEPPLFAHAHARTTDVTDEPAVVEIEPAASSRQLFFGHSA